MAKTSQETIQKINELYAVLGVKSQVAKQLGISPATVTKYLDPAYIPQKVEVKLNTTDFGELDMEMFNVYNLADLCVLTEEEEQEMAKIQGRLLI